MSKPDLSIIIATHNRLDFLQSCLAALAPQVKGQAVEVIVVDSCGSPQLAQGLKELVQRHDFRYERLETLGVAKARNRGAELCSAQWFATLDVDAVVNPGWLSGALIAIAKAEHDSGLIQGRVEPLWLDQVPDRVETRHARFLSIVLADSNHDMAGPAHCAGANMLVRRAALATIGGYGESFGRVGTNLASGIDTDLVERLRAAGQSIFYRNAFSVCHAVPGIRLTREWLRRRSIEDGRACGQIVFTRGGAVQRMRTVIKSLAALPLLMLMSLASPGSTDLLIRRWVNQGILEFAPKLGRLARAINARVAHHR